MFDNRARATQVAFGTRRGQEVLARLDIPRGRLRAYAVFAHCLGPDGDPSAEAFVAGLLEYGIGVLSFELTAPQAPPDAEGEARAAPTAEEGEPPLALDTQDIVDAASVLRVSHGAPELLVGHSLAGAAVLRAALDLHEVRAVATIAAPSDATHMLHLLEDDDTTIEARGEARLWVVDRFARLRAPFLDELEETEMRNALLALKRPLLVLHSPLDNVVGIDNARRIYDAARHPKSFVSLPGADHAFTRPEQAHVAGELVGAWAATVLPPEPPPPDEWREDGVAYARTTASTTRTEASAGGFPLVIDESEAAGGEDAGPDPFDLLCAALAGSTSLAVRARAQEEGWPLEEVTTRVTHERDGAVGPEAAARFAVEVRLVGAGLSEAQRARLLEAAERCPVRASLGRAAVIEARLV